MNILLLGILGACGHASARNDLPDDLLLHYPFNEGQGTVTADTSGNGLNGTVSAAWVDSPSGKALAFDGTPNSVVKAMLPENRRFGKNSWSFNAWLKPTQFTYNDPQNQRRIFAFGTWPDAYMVIDILGTGHLNYYFCYRNKAGETIATGGGAAVGLTLDTWAHVALVCDRNASQVELYIDGARQGLNMFPRDFAGDFVLGGELTLGSGWHNYWGLMDEVRIHLRALTQAEVRAEFARLKDTFGVRESPESAAAVKRESIMAAFTKSREDWVAGNYAAVRTACAAVAESTEAPTGWRSYARLRSAQSHMAEGRSDLARTEYAKIADTAAYPEVHRAEARERVSEIDRIAKGLPARDPAASRTKLPRVTMFDTEVFVSTQGNDANPGSKAEPVATLVRARDLVRALRAKGVGGAIAVNVLPGEYRVTAPLALSRQDSGAEQGPTVYRAVEPGKAVFYGGARIGGFQPVTDPDILKRLPEEARGKALKADLRAQGITDYGRLAVRGFGQPPSPPTLELFVNGKPMTLARWPNTGFVGIGKLIEPGARTEGKPSVFEYLNDRPARWTQAEDAWLFGYFRYLWADATIKIGGIDTAAKTIATAEPYHYIGPMDTSQGIIYYAFNLLEEIDRPGEWYLDRNTGALYLYPPTDDMANAVVEVGMLSTPMVTMNNVADVRLEGLTFDLGRGNGLMLTDCSRVLIAGCTVTRMAGNGVMIHGGEANGLLGCDIHTIGRRAAEVIGGDRANLKPGRHFVENCRIHNFGRIDRTYTPAIQLEGVGHRVAHNLMYNGPSSAMRIEGNDHIIEFNEFHSVVRESDDQGAIDIYRNPTYRGIVFRYNRFTNCGKTGAEAAVHGQAAIRFDDAISGMVVYGNIFIRSAHGHFGAVQMNSGRDNIVDNNLFVDCKQGISGGWNSGNSVWRMLAEGKRPADFFVSDLYLKRYPKIATMRDEPGINYLWRNVFYRCGQPVTGNPHLDLFENVVYDKLDPGFVNAAQGDHRFQPDAALFSKIAFRPIPVDEIGLYEDLYRASWPVATTPVDVPNWRLGLRILQNAGYPSVRHLRGGIRAWDGPIEAD